MPIRKCSLGRLYSKSNVATAASPDRNQRIPAGHEQGRIGSQAFTQQKAVVLQVQVQQQQKVQQQTQIQVAIEFTGCLKGKSSRSFSSMAATSGTAVQQQQQQVPILDDSTTLKLSTPVHGPVSICFSNPKDFYKKKHSGRKFVWYHHHHQPMEPPRSPTSRAGLI